LIEPKKKIGYEFTKEIHYIFIMQAKLLRFASFSEILPFKDKKQRYQISTKEKLRMVYHIMID
jgi:hypothetical protein